MRKVPKKNISSEMSDVRLPGSPSKKLQSDDVSALAPAAHFFLPSQNALSTPSLASGGKSKKTRFPFVRYVVAFLFIAVFSAGGVGFYAYRTQAKLLDLLQKDNAQVAEVWDGLERWLLGGEAGASQDSSFEKESFSTEWSIEALIKDASFKDLWWGLTHAGSAYRDLQRISQGTLKLFAAKDFFEERWFELVFKGKGEELIQELKGIHAELRAVAEAGGRLTEASERFESFLPLAPENYLELKTELSRIESFLGALVEWLDTEEPRRIIVFLANPAEIRPGGGFWGSYAEIVLSRGSLVEVSAHDINEIDRTLRTNLIPPRQLQALVGQWRTADANWYFNYPDSAKRALAFFADSEMYGGQNKEVHGVINFSGQVFADVLKTVGPIISLGTEFNAENFLFEIQKQVQVGQAEKVDNPKKILSDLLTILLGRIQELTPSQKKDLFALMTRAVADRNVALYLTQPELQSFVLRAGAGGEVFQSSEKSPGDYLAVVNANIGGAKTDLFMRQTIRLESQIQEDGAVVNRLELERLHRGDLAEDWWYREPNHNFVQIFTPQSSQFTLGEGILKKSIKPKTDYVKNDFKTDPFLLELESSEVPNSFFPDVYTIEAWGKKIFGAWSRTPLGATSKLQVEYRHRLDIPPQPGGVYTFVFERQAASKVRFQLEILAPVGFVFEENDKPIFEYESEDPPGRLIIPLTFRKI